MMMPTYIPTRLLCPRCNKRRGTYRNSRTSAAYCNKCGHQWDQKKVAEERFQTKMKALDKKWKAKH